MTLINEKFLFKNQNSSEVALIAQKLSKVLEIGDILLLKGPIGAGKSFFARCIINEFFKKFNIFEDIPSPSFSLIQTYDNIKPKFCHVDLYRMSFSSELEEIGLDNIYENFVSIIEWPERLGTKKPNRYIKIRFIYDENVNDERHLKISLIDIKSKKIFNWLQDLKKDYEELI